jgi:hypothetical protein
MKRSILRVGHLKAQWTGVKLGAGLEPEFGDLLDYSRGLKFDQIPDYKLWRTRFEDVALRLGVMPGEPLDWTPGQPPIALPQTDTSWEALHIDQALVEGEEEFESEDEDELEKFQNSYYGNDIDCWDFIQGERPQELTMPLGFRGRMDSLIPKITDVFTGVYIYNLTGL